MAGCDSDWIRTRDCSDVSRTEMQFLRQLRHSGALKRFAPNVGQEFDGTSGEPSQQRFEKCVGILPQNCASPQTCLGARRTISSPSLLVFCSDLQCQLWDLYIDRCVHFPIMSNHLNLPQVDSSQVVGTSQG